MLEEQELHSDVEKKLHWTLSSGSSMLAKTRESEKTMSEKEMVSITTDKFNFIAMYIICSYTNVYEISHDFPITYIITV